MRRVAVVLAPVLVLVLVLAAAAWPGARPAARLGGAAPVGQVVPAAAARADFDNDGVADLAVGIPGEGVGASGRAGAVSVLYGSAGGLTAADSQLLTQDTPGVPGRAEPRDEFGGAVAPGDFDGDGFTDLAVGAGGEDAGAAEDAGAVTVLYGSAGGLAAAGGRLLTQVGGVAEAGDRFGLASASGDFDGDGFADLAVGAPQEDVATAVDAGAVSVLPGSAGGLGRGGGRLFDQVGGAAENGDRFGGAVAAGDFDSDGFTDLAVGAPLEDVGAADDAGAVSELPGSAAGLTGAGARIHAERSSAGPQPSDLFGLALASGDFEGDGFADLAVGVPLDNAGPAPGDVGDAGAVNLLSGRPAGLLAGAEDLHRQPSNPELGDRFGTAVAAGDLNADGADDLAAAAPREDVGTVVNAGAVSILAGPAIGASSATFTQDTPGVGGRPEPDDLVGAALAVAGPAPSAG